MDVRLLRLSQPRLLIALRYTFWLLIIGGTTINLKPLSARSNRTAL